MDPETLALLANAIGRVQNGLQGFAHDLEERVQPPMVALGALANPISAFAEGMRVATQAIPHLGPVVDNLTRQFESMFSVAEAWVAALSPAIISSLNYQLRNLQATLGQAFLPAFQIAIDVVNRFAGVINPLTQQLAPAFHRLAEVLGLRFLDAAQDLVDVLTSMLPIINDMLENFVAFLDLVKAVQVVLAATAYEYEQLLSSLRGTANGLISFKDAHREAAKAIILFTAYTLRAVGALGALDALIARAGRGVPGEQGGALAAPQNVRIQDFASIASDMAKAAFAGGPGGERLKKPEDWLSEMKPILEDIRDKGLLGETNDMVKKFLVDAENWGKKMGPALDVLVGPVMADAIRNVTDIKRSGLRLLGGGIIGARILG